MKNLSLIALMCILCTLSTKSIAQKCDLDVDKVDLFSKDHIRSSQNNIGPKRDRWKLILQRTNDKYSWEMVIVYGVDVPKSIQKGESIAIRLENGNIITLVVDGEYPPVRSIGNMQILTHFQPKGELTEADMKKISESPITNMKTNLFGYSNEIEVTSKQGEAIEETAKCLLKP